MSPEQYQTLTRIESKIDSHAATHDKIEGRLNSLESSRAYATGAVAVLTAGVTLGWQWIKSAVTGH